MFSELKFNWRGDWKEKINTVTGGGYTCLYKTINESRLRYKYRARNNYLEKMRIQPKIKLNKNIWDDNENFM